MPSQTSKDDGDVRAWLQEVEATRAAVAATLRPRDGVWLTLRRHPA